MYREYSFLLCAVATCALGSSACAGSAVNLRPDAIPKDHGAVFGNVEFFMGEKNLTDGAVVTSMEALRLSTSDTSASILLRWTPGHSRPAPSWGEW